MITVLEGREAELVMSEADLLTFIIERKAGAAS